MAAALRTRLDERKGCDPEEAYYWLAPACEWDLVAHELARTRDGPDRHPLSGQWQAEYGRSIPGGTWMEQLEVIREWQDQAWRGDARRRNVTIFGTQQPSAIERAAGCWRTRPDWRERLQDFLDEHFTGTGWVATFLAPRPAYPAPPDAVHSSTGERR